MLVVGLTGGIGAGKTSVANLFAELGVPVVDADDIAREVVLPGEPAYVRVIEYFGQSVIATDGSLDRQQLRQRIFANPAEKAWLEETLHPLIRERIMQRLSLIRAPYCIVVIPLLVETMPYSFIDRILVVDADNAEQTKRVTARDQAAHGEIESILRAQASREERLAVADEVIVNNGSLQELVPRVRELHEAYLKQSK